MEFPMSRLYVETNTDFFTLLFCYINNNIAYILGEPEVKENYDSAILTDEEKRSIKNRIDNSIDVLYLSNIREIFSQVYKNNITIDTDNFCILKDNYDSYDFVCFPDMNPMKNVIEVYYSDTLEEEILTQLMLCKI